MSGRRRLYDGTQEQRAWRWLRKQAHPVSLAMICAEFGITKPAAAKTMQRLAAKGNVKRHGRTGATTYVAIGMPPDDFRGTALNTLLTLQKHTAAKQRGIRL